jgi:hypothetical protein
MIKEKAVSGMDVTFVSGINASCVVCMLHTNCNMPPNSVFRIACFATKNSGSELERVHQ